MWLCPSHRIFLHFTRRRLELDQRTSHSLDYDFFGTLFDNTITIFVNIYLSFTAGPFCFIAIFIIASLAAGSVNKSLFTLARLPSTCHPGLVRRQALPTTRLKTPSPLKTPKPLKPLKTLKPPKMQPNHRLPNHGLPNHRPPRRGRLLSRRSPPKRLASSPLSHLHALGAIFRLLRALPSAASEAVLRPQERNQSSLPSSFRLERRPGPMQRQNLAAITTRRRRMTMVKKSFSTSSRRRRLACLKRESATAPSWSGTQTFLDIFLTCN